MDLTDSMRSFVAVVEAEGFTAAARELSMPTSTLSRQVSRLEDRLGVRLLQRTTRSVRLTDAGRRYFDRCREVVTEIRELEESIRELHVTPRGRLRVTAPTSGRLPLVEDVISGYMAAFPEVTVEILLTNRFVDLIEEGFDVALRGGELTDSSLVARKLVDSRSRLIASPTYLNHFGRPESTSDLADHECLIYRPIMGRSTWPLEDGGSISVAGRLVTNSVEMIVHAALSGLGIGYVPAEAVAEELKAGEIEIVLEGVVGRTAGLYVVYPHQRHLSSAVRAFIDHAVEAARTFPELA